MLNEVFRVRITSGRVLQSLHETAREEKEF